MSERRRRSAKPARAHAASGSTSPRRSIFPVMAAEVGRVRRATPRGQVDSVLVRAVTRQWRCGGTLGGSGHLIPINQPTNVDLAGDGRGDQGGATLLEEGDGSLGFGDEGIQFGGLSGDGRDYR